MLTTAKLAASTAVLAALLACFATAASASLITAKYPDSAELSGNSVYWTLTTRNGVSSIRLTDFVAGNTSTIYSSPTAREFIGPTRAGGGRMAFSTAIFGNTRIASSVRTAGLDGSAIAPFQSGVFDGANDCGVEHMLLDVAPIGEIFIATLTRSRTGVQCGGASVGDVVTITGHSTSGATRTVYSQAGPIHKRKLLGSIILGGRVVGNNLAFGEPRAAHVIDLDTGVAARYPAVLSGSTLDIANVHADGRLVMSESALKRKRKRFRTRNGKLKTKTTYSARSRITLFERKLDPASGRKLFASNSKLGVARFCGDRILRATGGYDAPDLPYTNRVSEVDATGAVKREIVPSLTFAIDAMMDCDATNVLLRGVDFTKRRVGLDVSPLG